MKVCSFVLSPSSSFYYFLVLLSYVRVLVGSAAAAIASKKQAAISSLFSSALFIKLALKKGTHVPTISRSLRKVDHIQQQQRQNAS